MPDFRPVVVYASQTKKLFTVSEISKQDIDVLTEPIIEPALNATPGVWMQSGTLNTNRISIRGVGYREPFATTGIKVYLDEIPLTNGVGESSIEDISPFILSGIDIWRGPTSALWGSGLGGMIHLKTNLPLGNVCNTHLQAGSFDRFQFDQGILFTDFKWSTALHYQYLKDGGFRENNEVRKHSWTWMQGWHNQKGFSLKSFVHGIDLNAFIPSSLHFDDYQNKPLSAAPAWAAVRGNEDYAKWITGLNIRYESPKGWIYQGALFANTFQSDEVRPFNILKEGSTSYGIRHRISFQIRRFAFITSGLEVFREKYQFSTFETLPGGVPGDELSDQEELRSYFNTFLQSEFHLNDRFNLFAGLHGSISNLHGEDHKASFPFAIYPTGGIIYSLNSFLSFSASVSRGYSSLSLDELLNSSGMINPVISPETGWSKEISMSFTKYPLVKFKIHLFHMNIENTIITKRIDEDLFERINGGSSLHRGIELAYAFPEVLNEVEWKGAYTYSSNIFDDFVDGGNDFSGNRLPGSPAHRSFNRLTWSLPSTFSFNLDHHWVSDVFLTDDNEITGKGYQLVHFGIEYAFTTGMTEKWRWKVTGKIHNVFDIDYSPMFQINAIGTQPRYYYPGKPRAFYAGISVEYPLL